MYLLAKDCTHGDFFVENEPLKVGDYLYYDIEVYPNYFLAKFKTMSGSIIGVECFSNDPNTNPFSKKLLYIMCNFSLIGYNSINYDLPILKHVCSGKATLASVLAMSKDIVEGDRFAKLDDKYAYNYHIQPTHVDLINVAPDPLKVSLKMYGARMLTPHLQDLPYKPNSILTREQADQVALYCGNDLAMTEQLCLSLSTELQMREFMSKQFNTNLMSKSDAQIGEHVLVTLLEEKLGRKLQRASVDPVLHYTSPDYVKYTTPLLQNILEIVNNAEYVLDKNGSPQIPKEISEVEIKIGTTEYTLGIGGLHSTEKGQTIVCDENHRLRDIDVDSFYPRIIINQKYAPVGIEEEFTHVYEEKLVNTRLRNKKLSKDKSLSEEERTRYSKLQQSGKIVINGSYGKLGSIFSKLYAPQMMISVCLTGQLSLLMLIERMELNGIKVVSANTDGIVTYSTADQQDLLFSILEQWQKDCGFTTEITNYHAIYSANVNNYIAIKSDFDCQQKLDYKAKGMFEDVWFNKKSNFRLKKTPAFLVCRQAIIDYLMNGTPVDEYISNCKNFVAFTTVRQVRGGGKFREIGFGRIARFYISNKSNDCLQYVKNGNKVPQSDNAMLCMNLPDVIPDDLDYDFYIKYAKRLLVEMGAIELFRYNPLF